ncbi:MAG: hypothetical protein M3Y12_05685, partial [Bacteroidota bacterium]|nr:hypothetical protein [Bacteroidota bacterium]
PNLAACALHPALAVEARLPHGPTHAGAATVEEVSRPDDVAGPARGLLLDLGPIAQLPAGTTIWRMMPEPTVR